MSPDTQRKGRDDGVSSHMHAVLSSSHMNSKMAKWPLNKSPPLHHTTVSSWDADIYVVALDIALWVLMELHVHTHTLKNMLVCSAHTTSFLIPKCAPIYVIFIYSVIGTSWVDVVCLNLVQWKKCIHASVSFYCHVDFTPALIFCEN